MNSKDRVQWVYSSRDNKELEDRYDRWANDYDKDLEKDFAYRAPRVAAEYFAKYVHTEARILDAGAGTGLVGRVLTEMGYSNLIAMDISHIASLCKGQESPCF